MPAYLVGQMTITDPDRYKEYARQVPDFVTKYGGRYLARGGAVDALEGPDFTKRMVIIEFPDADAIRRFYADPDYAPIRDIRQSASEGQLLLVEGVPAAS